MELRLPHWLPAAIDGKAQTVAAAVNTNSTKHLEGVAAYVRQMIRMLFFPMTNMPGHVCSTQPLWTLLNAMGWISVKDGQVQLHFLYP